MPNFKKSIITYVHNMLRNDTSNSQNLQALKNLTCKNFLKDWNLFMNKKTLCSNEIGIGFWAFLNDEETMHILFKILNRLFRPRLLHISFVQDQRLEGVIVMSALNKCELCKIIQKHVHLQASLQRRIGLDITSLCACQSEAEIIETVLLHCLNLCKISAGCCKFEKYMDNAMITCLDRIQCGSVWHGSLHSTRNKDLFLLYQHKLQILHEQASAQVLLGMDLNLTNVAMMRETQRTLEDEVSKLQEQNDVLKQKLLTSTTQITNMQARWSRLTENLQTTLHALRHLKLISRFAWNQMMNIIHGNCQLRYNLNLVD